MGQMAFYTPAKTFNTAYVLNGIPIYIYIYNMERQN